MQVSMRNRTVIESERFARERGAIDGNVQRMDDVLFGTYEVLSSSPSIGRRTQNPKVRAITASNLRDAEFVIYYSVPDDDSIVLESIVRTTPDC